MEHTLIQPFEGEKEDTARFLKTLAVLENHPDLLEPGYAFHVSQRIGAIPTGIDWKAIPNEVLSQLRSILPSVPEGSTEIIVKTARWQLPLCVRRTRLPPDHAGTFGTARAWPGDPGPEIMLRALQDKVPKLSASRADLKILLLEKDAVAGTVESQFEQLPDLAEVQVLLGAIDQIWSVNTAALDSEHVIFTNQVMPEILDHSDYCSLNVETDEFWRVHR